MNEDVFGGKGVRITLPEQKDFLRIKETLTRIGVVEGEDTLVQICHILHKKGQYAILHYKELYVIDGRALPSSITEEDYGQRNTAARLLDQWGLADIVDQDLVPEESWGDDIVVIPYRDKGSWKLVAKYEIGVLKKKKKV